MISHCILVFFLAVLSVSVQARPVPPSQETSPGRQPLGNPFNTIRHPYVPSRSGSSASAPASLTAGTGKHEGPDTDTSSGSSPVETRSQQYPQVQSPQVQESHDPHDPQGRQFSQGLPKWVSHLRPATREVTSYVQYGQVQPYPQAPQDTRRSKSVAPQSSQEQQYPQYTQDTQRSKSVAPGYPPAVKPKQSKSGGQGPPPPPSSWRAPQDQGQSPWSPSNPSRSSWSPPNNSRGRKFPLHEQQSSPEDTKSPLPGSRTAGGGNRSSSSSSSRS